MVTMFNVKELRNLRQQLIEMCEAEATKLYRMARRALAHGCNLELVNEIREEAHQLHNTGYPERLLDPFITWKYAFRAESDKRWDVVAERFCNEDDC